MNNIIAKIKNILPLCKIKVSDFLVWLKDNADYKVIGLAALLGLITFSSWASLVLAALCGGVLFFLKKPMCVSVLNFVNIDVNKYVKNAIIGLVLASLFLLIV